jgi:2-polyprenyl-3-methyl-5-hydroxy-6-metoxy-1,4-benzoquinol methylase
LRLAHATNLLHAYTSNISFVVGQVCFDATPNSIDFVWSKTAGCGKMRQPRRQPLMDDHTIQQTLGRYKFYHVLPVTDTIRTAGWAPPVVQRTQAMVLNALRTLNVGGKRVLDVGCRDGLFSFEAEKLGAGEVIAIDNDLSRGAVEFLIPYFRSQVQMHELNLYDLTPDHFGLFDVVVCAGVLYHLRFPFWGLQRIRSVVRPGGTVLFETAVVHDDHPHALLYCPFGADSPYEPTSCSFYNVKGLFDSFRSLGLTPMRVEYLHSDPRHLNRVWPRFRRRLRAFLRGPQPLAVDRTVVTCRATAVDPAIANGRVLNYWHTTHDVHTVHEGQLT